MKTLRWYQSDAIAAIYAALRDRDDNPCVSLPTGAGKSLVIAQLCLDAIKHGDRVLVLAHVRELLEQNYGELIDAAPEIAGKVGVYSAGLKTRDTAQQIIIAGIQSVYQRIAELGRFDLVIVDEAHRIPADGEGMYRTMIGDLLALDPRTRVVGLTATPYRTGEGLICRPDNILNHLCHETPIAPLAAQGYLCRVRSKNGKQRYDTDGLKVRAGEFTAEGIAALYANADETEAAVGEFIGVLIAQERRAGLIFAASVQHGRQIAALFPPGMAGEIYGDTPDAERDDTVRRFRQGALRVLVNCNVLTLGFNVPHVDLIGLMRPTASPGLYVQMVGRGLRTADGKSDCILLDFGNNIERHGPIDAVRLSDRKAGTGPAPVKTCPACEYLIPAGCTTCPECGAEMPREHKVEAKSADAEPMAEPEVRPVARVEYRPHKKKGGQPGDPETMCVTYYQNFADRWGVSEWICFEHTGYPLRRALRWWGERTDLPMPDTAAEAVHIAMRGELRTPTEITVIPEGKYLRVIGYNLAEAKPVPATISLAEEDLPF